MFEMSSTSINAHMDTSGDGLSQPFKGSGKAANGFDRHKTRVGGLSVFSIAAEYARGF
jgi:hypothetical protein